MNKETLINEVSDLRELLILKATGGHVDNITYGRLRSRLLKTAVAEMVPDFVIHKRSIGEFWTFIKSEFETYQERRDYIWGHFRKILSHLESTGGNDFPSSETAEIKYPIVFISYSWDSESHKEWVLKLANQLRANGIDVILDRYHLVGGKNVSTFVEDSLRKSNRVITILTPKYQLKAKERTGGVGHEYSIINQELIADLKGNQKVIPVLRSGSGKQSIPVTLQQYLYVDFRKNEGYDDSFVELIRILHNAPEHVAPPLGEKPLFVKGKTKIQDLKEIPTIEEKEIQKKTSIEIINEKSKDLFSKNISDRKEATAAIVDVGHKLNFSTIKMLLKSHVTNFNIAGMIAAKSFMETNGFDIGENPDVKLAILDGMRSRDVIYRQSAIDVILSSKWLKVELLDEIKTISKVEKEEVIIKLIERIPGVVSDKQVTSESKSINRKIKKLIKKDRISEALNLLLEKCSEIEEMDCDEVITLKGRHERINSYKRQGTISLSELELSLNTISQSILEIVAVYQK